MIADLWHAPDDEKFLGTSTVGSSEACMLGGMAMKFRWRNNAIKQGLDVKAKTKLGYLLWLSGMLGKILCVLGH